MTLDTDNTTLENRIILITGAGDGIGKAVSIECARKGATVVLLGKTVKKLEIVYDEIIAAGGPQPAICPLDLEQAKPQDFDNLQTMLFGEFGRLDGVLHNAGWFGASTPIEHYDPELWQRVIQINLNAVFLMSRACIPLLLKSEHASMVFNVDRKSSAYWGAYGVAKAGQISLMHMLADELETRKVCVNALDPGVVRTSFRTRAYPGENPEHLNLPKDVAPAFAWMLSEAIDGTTGRLFGIADFDLKK